MRITEEQYNALIRRSACPVFPIVTPPPPKPSKYHNVITECDGIKFQSKKEARIFRELKARQHAGEIRFFLQQVPFRLSGGYKHLLDFLIIRADGTAEYLECKGRDLPMGKMKRKMVEDQYKIRIEVV